VVVPVPDKVTVESEAAGLPPGSARGEAVTNCDYPRFLAELREAGVDVFDPTPSGPPADRQPRFLRHDSHWTPEWMDEVAREVARHARAKVELPAATARYRTEEVAVRRSGDLVDMLGLPPDQALFPPQEVTVRRTLDAATGLPAEPNPSADVLLLGDSFTNIFTAQQMGWGDAAGFGPALARHLGRAVDVIAINGSGSSGTRRELARRPEGLAGKRVVIWEFAARELTLESWDVIPLAAAPAPQPGKSGAPALVVEATIEAVSKVPEPFSVPYPDCLTYVLLRVDRVVEGDYADKQILAVMWAMKKNVSLPPAKYQPGKRLRAKLIPMRDADPSVRTGQRADDIADFTHRPYFVTEEHGL
jgi:alginate O-acetyltransferase complex protein AlgJ